MIRFHACHRYIRKGRLAGPIAALIAGAAVLLAQPARAQVQLALNDATDRAPHFFLAAPGGTHALDISSTPVLARRIALDLDGATLKSALAAITNASGLSLAYSRDMVAMDTPVHLQAENITVAAALTDVLFDVGVDVVFNPDGRAALVPRVTTKTGRHQQQQGMRISGRVIDTTEHVPISAAAVLVTGTTVGQNTSDSGTFSFILPPDAKTLSVRRIGYLARTIPVVAGQTEYTIALQRDILRLQGEVVTGIATTVSTQNAANAVAVVSSQELNEAPSPTVETALEGKVPGALIEANNAGAPGGGVQVQIRGVTSINGNAEPLYVVDGVIVNNETVNSGAGAITLGGQGSSQLAPSFSDLSPNRISDLNPDDIESVEVLKGASASAIYGSKASAGVIIITTKKGSPGKPQWTVNSQVGHFADAAEIPMRQFPTLASAEGWYRNDIKGGADTSAASIAADNSYISSIYAGPQNYQSQLFGNSQLSYQENASVSGTSGATQYYLSGLWKYDNGTQLNTGYGKQTIRSNITEKVSSTLSVSANLSYMHDLTRRSLSGNDNISGVPYSIFPNTPQFVALDHPNADGAWPVNPFDPANPFADAMEIQTPEELSRFIGGASVNWTPWRTEHQSLQVNLVGGADLASLNDQLYAPPDLQVEQTTPTGLPGTAVSNLSQTNYLNYSVNVIDHYSGLSFLDATTSAGFEQDQRNFINGVTAAIGLLAGVDAPTVGSTQDNFYTHTAQQDQSLYFQEQVITLDNRLAVTAGITAERSSIDGNVDKFYAYPRYSASYRLPSFGFFDEFKLRAAYGQSGNLGAYGAKYTPFNTGFIAGQNVIENSGTLGDPNLRPETEQEIEMGFDATFLRSRAQFSATIYSKRLTDLLLDASVAPSQGYGSTEVNGGQFTDQGIELQLQGTPIQLHNGLTWISSVSFYRNYSVLNSLPVPAYATGGVGFGASYLGPGRSLTDIVNTNVLSADGVPVQVGDYSPDFILSLSNDFTWHNFRLHSLIDWDRGGNTIDASDFYFDFNGEYLWADSAVSANRLNKFIAGGEPYVQPASFLKVRELTLSYTLPRHITSQLAGNRISSARLSLTGYNLWLITHYDGLDPEVSWDGISTYTRGTDITPYPPSRSYFVGVTLGL